MSDQAKPAEKAAPVKVSSPQGRSPAYPLLPLGKALERATQLKDKEGFYTVPLTSAYAAWGISEKSSTTPQVVAALKYFGLIDYDGTGKSRSIKLTDLARRIILDVRPDSPDKPKLIKEAAVLPQVHRDILQQYPDGLPSDTTLQTYLVLDKGFNETGAKAAIASFKDTVKFAKIGMSDSMPTPASTSAEEVAPPAVIEVGDLVKVEVGGVLVFAEPKRVRAIHDAWVFVDDVEAGVEMENVEIVEKGQVKPPVEQKVAAPRLPLPTKDVEPIVPGTRELRFALKEGDVVIAYPDNLSADSVDDLDGFWQVFLKRARREAAVKKPDHPN